MKEVITKKSNKNTNQLLFNTLMLFPILGENIISTIFGDSVSKIFSIMSCFIILLFFIKGRMHIHMFLVDMFCLIILHAMITFVFASSSTIISVANNMITPYGLIAYFMLFMYIDIFIDDKNRLITVFKSMAIIMTISVFMNFIFTADLHIANNIEVFKEALATGYTNSRKWLFGHRNMIFIHHLMWIAFSYVQYKLEDRSYTKIFIIQITFTMLVGVVSWNSTMMAVTIILLVLEIFRNGIFSKISIIHYTLVYLILEIGIVFLRVQEIFSYLIVNILHRDLSFTGRTGIWNYYINQYSCSDILHKLFGNFGVTDLTVNSHNMLLGILSFTGMIGVFLYFLLYIFSIKRLYRERKTDSARFISIIIFGFLVNALTMEFYLQPLSAIYIGYRINKINEFINEKGNN